MMDPLSAIGLASAIVQFVDFGLRIVKRLEEFSSENPNEVPKSMRVISGQIPLLLNALSKIKSESRIARFDLDTKCILRGIVSGCMSQIAEVEAMINEISKTPGDSFKVKMKKVFISLKYDEKAWGVERNLNTYISVLILHQVVDSADTPPLQAEDSFFDIREKRVPIFIERPALMERLENDLHHVARSQVTVPTIVTLVGEKGFGKTQLALEYCHQAHSLGQFRTAFLIDASTLENLSLGFEGIYATIKRSMHGSRQEKISFVSGFLSDLWHPWLLILDNYNPSVIYNEIMDFLPHRGYGGIILITRSEKLDGLGKVLRVPKYLSKEDQNQLNRMLVGKVQSKDLEGIKDLVNQGADVNTLLWNEWPCLHRVSLFGMDEAVEFLLERGANPNPSIDIYLPIYWAAGDGHESICRMLLDHEDQNGQYMKAADSQSAFNAASKNGNVNIMRMLLSRREIKMSSKDQYGSTPLQSAAAKGHVELVKLLIEMGVLLEDHSQGDKALLAAALGGHLEVLKVLCEKGKVNVNVHDKEGATALCHAVQLKDTAYVENGEEMAKYLLSKGADPNPPFENAEGPLHKASIQGHKKSAQLLISHKANPTRSGQGFDSLSNSIKYNHPEITTLLINTPIADKSKRNQWLESSLCYASRSGKRSFVLQLLEAGTEINTFIRNGHPEGATPLLLSILNKEVKTAQLLIRKGAKQDIPDSHGRLPLPEAAEHGLELVVRDLIRAGGDVNIKSGKNEDTPLMLAVAKNHEKTVQVLLANGADKEATNKFGDIASDIADEVQNKKIIELLSE